MTEKELDIASPGLQRENKSRKKSLANAELTIESKRNQRAISMQDMAETLAKKARESRSVSFNGVSVMVDAALKWSNVSKERKTQISVAVNENKIDVLRKQVSAEPVNLKIALQATIEKDNVGLMRELLKDYGDINKYFDSCGQTILSAAVEAEAVQCLGHLLSVQANPNKWDASERFTPMHSLALTSSKTTEIFDLLVKHGGDIDNGVDRNGFSVLHFAVRNNNIALVKRLLEKRVKTVTKAFHETALHVAAEHDLHQIAELLLEANRGCVDALRDERERLSPLHVVAEAGYALTCQVLIKAGAEVGRVTGHKMTAIHLAARGCNAEVLTMLLEHAARINTELVNSRDEDGRTPLFVCSSSERQGATECMRELIRFGAVLDIQNSHGNTALHNSAIAEKASRVKLLISQGADLSVKNDADLSALYFVNKRVPQCMKAFEERLDTGLKLEGGITDMNSKVKIDFNKLSPNIYSLQKQDISIFLELMKSPYKTLLKHPLSEAFLHLKWKQIKYIHFILIIITHFIYSSVYTLYALLVFGSICEPDNNTRIGNIDFNWSSPDIIAAVRFNWSLPVECHTSREEEYRIKIELAQVAWVFLIIFTVMYLINESIKVVSAPKTYFKKWDTYIDLSLIISFLFISFHANPFEDFSMGLWQWHLAALGCFLTWLQMMFYIGKLPRFGKYVQMFRTVALGVLNFLIAYVFLIVGFAVAFMILFPNPDQEVFTLLPLALIQLCVMMLGEIDFADLIQGQMFPVTAHLLIILFLFLVSIILMNLLVGLAVSDIQGLSKSAKINQLQQQVELINYMENLLFSPLFSVLPDRLKLVLRNKLQGLEGQKYKLVYTVKPFDSNDKLFSESLKKSLYENCLKRVSKEKEFNQNAALIEMQARINQMYQVMILGDKQQARPGLDKSISKLSMLSSGSAFSSSQLQVDDDLESDSDEEQPTFSNLSSIVEEGPGSVRRRRRRESETSTGTVESDLGPGSLTNINHHIHI